MPTWDERFRRGEYPTDPDPHPVLERYLPTFPDGRALDVATGTGRNAVRLAEAGYHVDAVDQSREGLKITRRNARAAGVADRVSPIQADIPTYTFPEATYAVVTVSFYRVVDRLPDVVDSLVEGGCLFVQHHLRTTDDVDGGPSTDRYRFAANELLRAGLGLTVLHYDERTNSDGGTRTATAQLVARNSTGQRQSYPDIGPR